MARLSGHHLRAICAQDQGRGQRLAVAEAACAAHERILIRHGFDHRGQQNHGMDRFPGRMEAAFIARGDDHVHAGFLETQSALDGRDNMHPGDPGALDLVLPADGVAGGGEDHFEVVLNSGFSSRTLMAVSIMTVE